VAKALQTKELQDAWRALGAEAGGQSPEDLGRLVNSEITKWTKVVKESGAKVD